MCKHNDEGCAVRLDDFTILNNRRWFWLRCNKYLRNKWLIVIVNFLFFFNRKKEKLKKKQPLAKLYGQSVFEASLIHCLLATILFYFWQLKSAWKPQSHIQQDVKRCTGNETVYTFTVPKSNVYGCERVKWTYTPEYFLTFTVCFSRGVFLSKMKMTV